jgi:hypothetical protein
MHSDGAGQRRPLRCPGVIHMAKFTVIVTEIYCKAVEIEAPDAETAEAVIQGQWDQGEIGLANERDTFDHVEVGAEVSEGAENVANISV